MEQSFLYDGIDARQLGLTWVPEQRDTAVFMPQKQTLSESIFEGHNGGYYFGKTTQPKEFSQRCAFENRSIYEGYLDMVLSHFRPGKTAKLVFTDRPWCWYTATVTNVDASGQTNYANGLIVIAMKAYYPYAESDWRHIYDSIADGVHAMPEGFFDAGENGRQGEFFRTDEERLYRCENNLPCPGNWLYDSRGERIVDNWERSYAASIPFGGNMWYSNYYGSTADDETHTYYRLTEEPLETIQINPGNVRAPLTIWLAGNFGDGVTVRNETTGQEFEVTGVTYANTTERNRFFIYNSKYGQAYFASADDFNPQKTEAYLNHNGGSIEQEPAQWRGGYTGVYDNNKYFTLSDDTERLFTPQDAGKMLILRYPKQNEEGNNRRYFRTCSYTIQNAAKLRTGTDIMPDSLGNNVACRAMFCTVNKIKIIPKSTWHYTNVSYIFNPTFY